MAREFLQRCGNVSLQIAITANSYTRILYFFTLLHRTTIRQRYMVNTEVRNNIVVQACTSPEKNSLHTNTANGKSLTKNANCSQVVQMTSILKICNNESETYIQKLQKNCDTAYRSLPKKSDQCESIKAQMWSFQR